MFKKSFLAIVIMSMIAMLFSCGNVEIVENKEVTIEIQNENLADRTIMYYMLGTDLEENLLSATQTISEICNAKYPENMNFIMITGGCVNENVEKT